MNNFLLRVIWMLFGVNVVFFLAAIYDDGDVDAWHLLPMVLCLIAVTLAEWAKEL